MIYQHARRRAEQDQMTADAYKMRNILAGLNIVDGYSEEAAIQNILTTVQVKPEFPKSRTRVRRINK